MNLLGQSVFFPGTDGEDFVLAQDPTIFTVGKGLCAGVVAWEAEKAR
jgi:hypothetical protein